MPYNRFKETTMAISPAQATRMTPEEVGELTRYESIFDQFLPRGYNAATGKATFNFNEEKFEGKPVPPPRQKVITELIKLYENPACGWKRVWFSPGGGMGGAFMQFEATVEPPPRGGGTH